MNISYLHIAQNPDDPSKPMILNVPAPFPCLELQMQVLGAEKLTTERKEFNDESGYLFVFGKGWKKPFPSVIVYAYTAKDGNTVLHDFQKEDLRIVPYAIITYLQEK